MCISDKGLRSLRIKIGGISFAITLNKPKDYHIFEKIYHEFFTNDDPNIILQVNHKEMPDLNGWKKVFDSGSVWCLWQSNNMWAISLHSPLLEPSIYQLVILDSAFERGEIYIRKIPSGESSFPFEYALAEVLTVILLAMGRGVLMHACAIKDGETGRLFVGTSGAGKSTTARIWASQESAQILCDDRVILRKHEGRFWMYGTPWHGDVHAVSSKAVPLEQIFILRHASKNSATLLKPADAVSQLFVRTFPTFWDNAGINFTLEFLAEMSLAVPCNDLGFVPDQSAVDFVRELTPT